MNNESEHRSARFRSRVEKVFSEDFLAEKVFRSFGKIDNTKSKKRMEHVTHSRLRSGGEESKTTAHILESEAILYSSHSAM